MLKDLRSTVAETTTRDQVPLERLVRVRPRTASARTSRPGQGLSASGSCSPVPANVDDSVSALGSANWWWLAGAVAMSAFTYLAAGSRHDRRGGRAAATHADDAGRWLPVRQPCDAGRRFGAQRRSTCASMQKAGISPAEAVTGVGLNVVAGGIVHVVLLDRLLRRARQGDAAGFSVPARSCSSPSPSCSPSPGSSWRPAAAEGSFASVCSPRCASHSSASRPSLVRPAGLTALFGGSIGVTLAYITALACTLTAFDSGLSYAEVGAVYLGASLIAAAAPTPGGLGALEALVAGCTGLGVDPSIAVAAVLSYRLLTFWLPILPGWLCFHLAQRRNYI